MSPSALAATTRWLHAAAALLLAIAPWPAAAQDPAPPPQPDALDLVQVVAHAPTVHLFALAHDDTRPATLPVGDLVARAGGKPLVLAEAPPTGLATVLLVDVSRSIGRSSFAEVRRVLRDWVDRMGPDDRAAVVTFGEDVRAVQGFTADKALLARVIDGLDAQGRTTRLYGGLAKAIDLARRDDPSLPMRRAVFVVTDGIDDQIGAATAARIERTLATDSVPLYVLGLMPDTPTGRQALGMMSGLAEQSAGALEAPSAARPGDLQPPYQRLRQWIGGVMHLSATCSGCTGGGATVPVTLLARAGDVRLRSDRTATFDGDWSAPPRESPWWRRVLEHTSIRLKISLDSLVKLLLAGLALLGVGAAGTVYYIVEEKRKRTPDTPVKPDEPAGPPAVGVLTIRHDLIIVAGSRTKAARLLVTPMGRNEPPATEVLFEQPLTVGRAPECDIRINNDDRVSSHHCQLSPAGRSILVEDLRSRNGTSVNGVPIKGRLHAEPQSMLGIGLTELRLQIKPAGDA